MLCASLWETCPFLNRDGGEVMGEGEDGKGKGMREEEGSENWLVCKQMKKNVFFF